MAGFTREIKVNAPIEQVWEALGDSCASAGTPSYLRGSSRRRTASWASQRAFWFVGPTGTRCRSSSRVRGVLASSSIRIDDRSLGMAFSFFTAPSAGGLFLEGQGGGVDAIAFSGWSGPVVEDVA